MYEDYKEYVKQYLIKMGGDASPNPSQPYRSRFQHTLRVCKWIERLIEGEEGLDKEALRIAAIFHDVGYEKDDKYAHAERGALIFEEFAKEKGLPAELTEKVKFLIAKHSKKTPYEDTFPVELAYLRDADLLDEEGAMGIVWDCLAAGCLRVESYDDALARIREYSASEKHLSSTCMITPRAKEFWNKKLEFINTFVTELESDLEKEG